MKQRHAIKAKVAGVSEARFIVPVGLLKGEAKLQTMGAPYPENIVTIAGLTAIGPSGILNPLAEMVNTVVTTHMKPGYLRKNGVPYSANAVLTDYFDCLELDGVSYRF